MMSSPFLFASVLFIAFLPSSMLPVSNDSVLVFTNQAEFSDYVRISSRWTTPKPVPTINPGEQKAFEMIQDAPDMMGRPCSEIIFFNILSACGDTCTGDGDSNMAKEMCEGIEFSDKDIQEVCCPGRINKKKKKAKKNRKIISANNSTIITNSNNDTFTDSSSQPAEINQINSTLAI